MKLKQTLQALEVIVKNNPFDTGFASGYIYRITHCRDDVAASKSTQLVNLKKLADGIKSNIYYYNISLNKIGKGINSKDLSFMIKNNECILSIVKKIHP